MLSPVTVSSSSLLFPCPLPLRATILNIFSAPDGAKTLTSYAKPSAVSTISRHLRLGEIDLAEDIIMMMLLRLSRIKQKITTIYGLVNLEEVPEFVPLTITTIPGLIDLDEVPELVPFDEFIQVESCPHCRITIYRAKL
ncbi:hypothetical protein DFH07DRAFT_972974 [Mycena maculata]|uniref:Uncharacterized protein n=1 Tax=Mycena maculata TaxID=230809 RepID=A0AAD7MIN4_9AGAR|nr:hypothetical protein DFH07DRAFT_972974 [Mycena maculata]